MIVIDTSALMAILLGEPKAARCMRCIEQEPELAMSAVTLSEALIVATGRSLRVEMSELIAGLGVEIVPVGEALARRTAAAYTKWGKGVHKASLNFGDCFAYALAHERGAKLLFVGADFSKTDIDAAI